MTEEGGRKTGDGGRETAMVVPNAPLNRSKHRSRWSPEEINRMEEKPPETQWEDKKLSHLWFLAPLASLRFLSFPHSLPLELASRQIRRVSQPIEVSTEAEEDQAMDQRRCATMRKTRIIFFPPDRKAPTTP